MTQLPGHADYPNVTVISSPRPCPSLTGVREFQPPAPPLSPMSAVTVVVPTTDRHLYLYCGRHGVTTIQLHPSPPVLTQIVTSSWTTNETTYKQQSSTPTPPSATQTTKTTDKYRQRTQTQYGVLYNNETPSVFYTTTRWSLHINRANKSERQ